ncbi:hypothetical protein [Accumulibacter sp.]|uniref:hypothetical protein n=1 Tax=Accumulibacter sp. TaxID=2053492 RepID=UPI00260369CA|nr:hypothetical protein [Accumulibacter sp.]
MTFGIASGRQSPEDLDQQFDDSRLADDRPGNQRPLENRLAEALRLFLLTSAR